MNIDINIKDYEKWFEMKDYQYTKTPFCVMVPKDLGVTVTTKDEDESDKPHICLIHRGGIAFYTNTPERNKMTAEEIAQDFISKHKDGVEVTLDEMKRIAIARLLHNMGEKE